MSPEDACPKATAEASILSSIHVVFECPFCLVQCHHRSTTRSGLLRCRQCTRSWCYLITKDDDEYTVHVKPNTLETPRRTSPP